MVPQSYYVYRQPPPAPLPTYCCLLSPSKQQLDKLTHSIFLLFAPLYPETLLSMPQATPYISTTLQLTSVGLQLYQNITGFLMFSSVRSKATFGELLHLLLLIDLVCQKERAKKEQAKLDSSASSSVPASSDRITIDQFGTLLLTCLILSEKLNRDAPYSNSWWSRLVNAPLDVINNSEIVILTKLNFQLMIRDTELSDLLVLFS